MKLVHIHCHADNAEIITRFRLEYHPDLLSIYEDLGIIEITDEGIRSDELRRLQKILRLKRNCGVNTAGAAIIVDLLEKIETLQDEIEGLRRK